MTEGTVETRAAEVSHHVASANGVRIHYRKVGHGADVVVCLHGFPQTGRSWERVADGLADRFTVVVPDLRGAGESQRPATGYDKKTMATDVHELVRSLGFDRIHLVGHDIGGMVAYAYAAQWPGEVIDLTMIEMLLPGFGIEALFAIRQPGQFAHMPFFMAQDLPEWLVSGREAAFLDWFIRNNIVDQTAFAPGDIAEYAEVYARPGALRAAFDMFRAFWTDAQDNRTFAGTKLSMPVLAVGGAQSSRDALQKSLVPLADDVKGIVVENCGHFVPDERPERLVQELTSFFRP